MREFFINLFETRQEPFDVTLYSIWHILYAVTIFAAIIGMAFYLRKKDISTKERVLNIIAYAIAVVYIGDFFHFQRALQGHGVIRISSDKEHGL